jgi:hypothetical protein
MSRQRLLEEFNHYMRAAYHGGEPLQRSGVGITSEELKMAFFGGAAGGIKILLRDQATEPDLVNLLALADLVNPRDLQDDIRLLEEFNHYMRAVYRGAEPLRRSGVGITSEELELKMAFFSGAAGGIKILLRDLSPGDQAAEADLANLRDLQDEIQACAKALREAKKRALERALAECIEFVREPRGERAARKDRKK